MWKNKSNQIKSRKDQKRRDTRHAQTKDKIGVPTPEAKPATIFKPRTLLHYATINEFCQWQKRFKAYYKQSNVEEENPDLHCAFHNTCIDDNLADVIERETASKDARVYNNKSQTPFMKILEKYFDNNQLDESVKKGELV